MHVVSSTPRLQARTATAQVTTTADGTFADVSVSAKIRNKWFDEQSDSSGCFWSAPKTLEVMQRQAHRAHEDLQEVRALDGVTEIQRGPEFHCQLAGSNQHRPLGPYTNLASLLSRMHRDWPSLDPMHGTHAALRQPHTTLLPVHRGAPSTQESGLARGVLLLLGEHLCANSFGGCVWPLSCSRNTLPFVMEVQFSLFLRLFIEGSLDLCFLRALPPSASCFPSGATGICGLLVAGFRPWASVLHRLNLQVRLALRKRP